MRRDVLLNWGFGSTFGWSILGMNIFCQWANDPGLRPLMGKPIEDAGQHLTDPLRLLEVTPAIDESNKRLAALTSGWDGEDILEVDAKVIDPVGFGIRPSAFFGPINIGRCIFEDTRFGDAKGIFAKYDALLVASNWSAEILRAKTDKAIRIIHEGVDTSLFCPGAKSGVMDASKFYIFSGGKIEYRKGQDLVILAFREFAKKHPDAVLVTNWHNLWPKLSAGFKGRLEVPVQIGPHGWLDILKWIEDNGVNPKQVIDTGMVPNRIMPHILREMDVCLQPSRAEACTSLPVKEAMACGIPVIAGLNTGMRDLLTPENSLILTRQGPVRDSQLGDTGTDGWGESDVDEIVAQLEWAYQNRAAARGLGLAASRWIEREGRTWRSHAKALKEFALSLE